MKAYNRLSVKLFGKVANVFLPSFSSLKPYLIGANMNVLLRTWVSMAIFATIIVYVVSLLGVLVVGLFIQFDFIAFVYYTIFLPIMLASFCFLFFYVYPIQKAKSVRQSIENNLPFALAHMNAIASSGIPPEFMFELLMGFREYGEISRQAGLVVNNIKTFGMSSVNALKNVSDKTPSPAFRQVLTGIQAVIEKGGDLSSFLSEMSQRSLFEYRIRRENYLKTLSTYADIFTAMLITAPLMMLVVLGIMSTIGGDVLGFGIQEFTSLIIFVIVPLMNIGFISFLHVSSPEV